HFCYTIIWIRYAGNDTYALMSQHFFLFIRTAHHPNFDFQFDSHWFLLNSTSCISSTMPRITHHISFQTLLFLCLSSRYTIYIQ
ncbi:hypothetical protein ACJX0J_040529, partial [Zea mays]